MGDLSSSDFSSPTKAKKNFRILKETVYKQRKKIKSLHGSVRRLKARIVTLNDLIIVLKGKFDVTESSEVAIRVSNSPNGSFIDNNNGY